MLQALKKFFFAQNIKKFQMRLFCEQKHSTKKSDCSKKPKKTLAERTSKKVVVSGIRTSVLLLLKKRSLATKRSGRFRLSVVPVSD